MTPVELTSLLGGLFVAIGTAGTTIYTTRSKKVIDSTKVQATSWTEFTTKLQQERDGLLNRVDTMETNHRKRLRELEDDYGAQLAAAKLRITQLEKEVDELYRRLYSKDSKDARET